MRQNENQRNEQENFALKRQKQRDFRLAERHEGLLKAGLESIREAERHVNAECPDRDFGQLLVRGEQVNNCVRRKLHDAPDGYREQHRNQNVVPYHLLHAVRAVCAEIVAQNRLCALRKTGQR